MRADAIGLFWEDIPVVKTKAGGKRERGPMPVIPYTGWKPPTEFPNLSAAKIVGFDTETYDPQLLQAGPGWSRNSGHIIGVSLAVEDGSSWYFPIRHGIEGDKQVLPPEEAAMNMDPAQVLSFVDHVLNTDRPKTGANLIYDLGWLVEEGVRVKGPLFDAQFAEALLNSEAPDVSLDALALNYLGEGKVTDTLYAWLAKWCGGRPTDRQRANMYLSPPSLAGPYAEADASHPIRILSKQWAAMYQRGVLDLYDTECRLIPLLVKMRFAGAPVNLNTAEQLYDELGTDLVVIEQKLRDIAGQPVNPNARDSLLKAFEKVGLPTPTKIDTKTKEEKVSFDAGVLEDIDHPLAAAILEHRQATKVRDVFVKSYILNKNVDGYLHCSFHPLKNDKSGARSGRFSSSDPNLQNIPVRTEIGKRVRKCFEDHHGRAWVKGDYSQIEYRMLAHHAVGPGAHELRHAYITDPLVDYHDLTAALVLRLTGIKLPRKSIKNINFGLIYGMSELKLAAQLGVDAAGSKQLFKAYHTGAPFAKATMDAASEEAEQYGYVTTVLGRRSDFNMWTSKTRRNQGEVSYEEACSLWGHSNIERSRKHKALNRKLQGGAADVMKRAMVRAYEAGFFEDYACGIPRLTVHDELDFIDIREPDTTVWRDLQHCMETAMPMLRIPVKMEFGSGPNWGSIE
jgi:DNA polymerase-1